MRLLSIGRFGERTNGQNRDDGSRHLPRGEAVSDQRSLPGSIGPRRFRLPFIVKVKLRGKDVANALRIVLAIASEPALGIVI